MRPNEPQARVAITWRTEPASPTQLAACDRLWVRLLGHSGPQTPPHVDSSPLTCFRCGAIDQPAIAPGNGPHAARAMCSQCGGFIKWLSTRSLAERQARREQAREAIMAQRPPSARQLAYLVALGDDGPPPATMAEASQRIDAALARGRMA